MKRVWKILLAATVMSLAFCLMVGMTVFAEVIEGGYTDSETVFWKMDTDTKTLTLFGSGPAPGNPLPEGFSYSDFQRIVLEDGITDANMWKTPLHGITLVVGKDVKELSGALYQADAVIVSEENPCYKMYDGCLYNSDYSNLLYCVPKRDSIALHPNTQELSALVTLSESDGPNKFTVLPDHKYFAVYDDCLYTKDYSTLLYCASNRDLIRLHANAQEIKTSYIYSAKAFSIPSNHQYLALYEGNLYTKDYSTLLACPVYRSDTVFHSNLTTIDCQFIHLENTRTLVIPWGVKWLNSGAFYQLPYSSEYTVVFPDTLIDYIMGEVYYELAISRDVNLLYSDKNQLMVRTYGVPTDETMVEWAAYYPGHAPKIQIKNPKNGWIQENGKWYYYRNNQRVTGWIQDKGYWYYLDKSGVMKTGWLLDQGTWYCLHPWGGLISNGWYKIDGNWYHFKIWGGMDRNQWIYGLDKKWYYVGDSGAMLTNTRTPDGYWVNASGVWVK